MCYHVEGSSTQLHTWDMLAVTPLRGSNGEGRDMGDAGDFSMLEDFSDRTLLEDINFDDIFVGFDVDGDILPDLEMDPNEILAEFSVGGEEESGTTGTTTDAGEGMSSGVMDVTEGVQVEVVTEGGGRNEEDNRDPSYSEEVLSSTAAKDPVATPSSEARSPSSEAERGRKHSAAAGKNAPGKRKVKVDWTPELHRRFVQAVEQLGVDKAVPSRILELMGIDCLTRHNIASHLQKYRSHRKHLLAREAEAASWSQRRQMYAAGAGPKRDINPWLTPTIGFPPAPPPSAPPAAAAPAVQAYRPLHVWGHPTMEQPLVPMWPRHLTPRTPAPAWAPQLPLPSPPPPDASYWRHHYQRGAREGWIPHAMTQGTPCFPQPLPTPKFPAPAVPGIVPHPMYRPVPPPMASKQTASQLQLETHPVSFVIIVSNESIDAAIGDILKKPLSPLPLGLKPPSLDSVLNELQKQGVSKVPPPTCTT